MNNRVPHRVTRAYARGLVAAVALFSVALVVASWGLISLGLDRAPISTEVSRATAPLIIGLCIAELAFLLWREVMHLVRGNNPNWMLLIIVPGFAYLTWSLLGTAVNLSLQETWLSPFALALTGAWLIGVLLFWAVFLRKIYSGKERPLWPWEKNNPDEGPDWFTRNEQP